VYNVKSITCVETDNRNELQKTCPVCSNLFMATSEGVDRRPFAACGNGDTICYDCYKEHRKRPNGKCPTCGEDLLPIPAVNKTLMQLIENCASVLEISVTEIEMEKEPFARGGFGAVYKASWRRENVVVKAIKTVSDDEKQAVRRESNLTLRLNHPNVIKLFGITCVKLKKLGIVMESAEHGSLDKLIGEIDREHLSKIALGIINGLNYMHSQHVIHRDIKPQNVLMCGSKDDMIPKIADFGVSKVIQTAIKTHTRVGQDLYMAPEVKMNLQYGFPADIFSLAMMLFEMFNEQLIPLSSDEVKDFMMAVTFGTIGNIPKSCKVPFYLRHIIERGWCVNPEERPTLYEFQSAFQG